MNPFHRISSPSEHPLINSYSQPTDQGKEFANRFSASLEQQCDGELSTMLEVARKDRDPEMVRLVGQHLVHANADQRQTIVRWTTTLSLEQRAVFDAGSQTDLRNALEQNHPCEEAKAKVDRWCKLLDGDQSQAFVEGKRAGLLSHLTRKYIGTKLTEHLDALSMARLSLVSKQIRTQIMEHPRFEAVDLMKDFPDRHQLNSDLWVAQCKSFLKRIQQSACVETKVEGLTRMARQLFPYNDWDNMRLQLLAAINELQPSHIRAQPLAALMTSVQNLPSFTSQVLLRPGQGQYPDPDCHGYDIPLAQIKHTEFRKEDGSDLMLRQLWQSAMNLDPGWQKPVMTALLNRSCGRPELIDTILKEVHESDNEHWKSTLLIALGDCYQPIRLNGRADADEKRVEAVLTLMQQTKGGPEFLADRLLPDFIAKRGRLDLQEFSILLNFISALAPSDLQRPSLLALGETLACSFDSGDVLDKKIAAMLKVCEATEDRNFEYALRLEVNKGIDRLWRDSEYEDTNVRRFQRESWRATARFEGNQKTALLATLGYADISDVLTTNLSKRIGTRTLIALAATSQLDEVDALIPHLLQFPKENSPELLVALIKKFECTDINYFVDAIGQLPMEQQARPLRALMYRFSYANAREFGQHVLALGELCRQSPRKAEMLWNLSILCTGVIQNRMREAVPLPVELFDAIHNDMARMSDVDRSATYFALNEMVGLYPEEIATTRRAKLQTVFKGLQKLATSADCL